MFSALYEPCLENIFLARLSNLSATKLSEKNLKAEFSIITLGEVIRSSRYVLFLLFRGSTTSFEFIDSVRNLVAHKNSNCSRKSSSNRLFFLF